MERIQSNRREGAGDNLIHYQVRKIKKEGEEIKDRWAHPWIIEVRPALRDLSQRLSRSPLGRSGLAISIGN